MSERPPEPLPDFVCSACGEGREWPREEPAYTIAACNVLACDGHLPLLTRPLAYQLARALGDLALRGDGLTKKGAATQ